MQFEPKSLWAEHIGEDSDVIAAIATHIGAAGIANGKAHPSAPLRRYS